MEVVFVTERSSDSSVPTPNLEGWQESDEIICRVCEFPARINPDNPQQKGCGNCGFITRSSVLFKTARG